MVRYGRCVRCSRHLKAAQSVVQGIGPVCVKYFGGREAFAAVLAGVTLPVPAPVVEVEADDPFDDDWASTPADRDRRDAEASSQEARDWEGEQVTPFGYQGWAQELAEADAEAQEAARVLVASAEVIEARRVGADADVELAAWGELFATVRPVRNLA